MSDEKTYRVQVEVSPYAPEEYKKHSLLAARRKLGNELFDVLWKSKLPAVVDIQETIITPKDKEYWNPFSKEYEIRFTQAEIIRITATVTEVQHRHITIAHSPSMDLGYLGTRSDNPFKRMLRWLSKVAS